MRYILFILLLAAQGASAGTQIGPDCPPPMEFANRKAQLMEELRQTRNGDTGLFLTRHLVALYVTAPNRRAQDLLNTGINMRRMDDLDAATTAIDALISYCPTFAEGYHQRALVRRSLGDYEGALADLNTALSHAPDHLGAMARKVQVLRSMGRHSDGNVLREQVLSLNPWMPERFMRSDLPGVEL